MVLDLLACDYYGMPETRALAPARFGRHAPGLSCLVTLCCTSREDASQCDWHKFRLDFGFDTRSSIAPACLRGRARWRAYIPYMTSDTVTIIRHPLKGYLARRVPSCCLQAVLGCFQLVKILKVCFPGGLCTH